MHYSSHNYEKYIYKLKSGDCIVIHKNYTHYYMILVGVLNVSKVFTNTELYAISIISDGHIFLPSFNHDYATNYYYQLKALKTTYVISLKSSFCHSFKITKSKYSTFEADRHYYLTDILIHKHTKYRLVHLLLILIKSFGFVESNTIIIPLNLSYKTLGTMIGSNASSVGKILRMLDKQKIVKHRRNWINIYNIKELIGLQNNDL